MHGKEKSINSSEKAFVGITSARANVKPTLILLHQCKGDQAPLVRTNDRKRSSQKMYFVCSPSKDSIGTFLTASPGLAYSASKVAIKVLTLSLRSDTHSPHAQCSNWWYGPLLLGDNNSVALNTLVPPSVIKKKHHACGYHWVWEAIAGGIMKSVHILGASINYADKLSKPCSH